MPSICYIDTKAAHIVNLFHFSMLGSKMWAKNRAAIVVQCVSFVLCCVFDLNAMLLADSQRIYRKITSGQKKIA